MVIYIGNLSVETSERELSELFSQYGQVASINVMKDDVSGGTLGFAFVEMPADNEASKAIVSLNRKKIADRIVMVCEAPERTERRHSTQRTSARVRGK